VSKGKNYLWVIGLLSLVVAATAKAAPTVDNSYQRRIIGGLDLLSNSRASIASGVNQITESHSFYLTDISEEFLKPPAPFTGSLASSADIKSLPAVPRALLMVLTGFLCVSLVKDRKVWLAALVGILWAGQAGMQVLPQLALHLSHKNHITRQLQSEEPNCVYCLRDSNRLRSDLEGTQYIGLLRHLAGIPEAKSSYPDKDIFASHLAIIIEPEGLYSQSDRQPYKAEWHNKYFSPQFIFAELPRGPPHLA